MGIYRRICYLVEDIIVNLLGKNQSPDVIKTKVEQYRNIAEEQDLQNSVL